MMDGTGSLVPPSSIVYTPPLVAQQMVESVRNPGHKVWLDPCVGRGVFADAIQRAVGQAADILTLDIQAFIPNDRWRNDENRGVDFIDWSDRNRKSVDSIVMNPPYVALGRIAPALRRTAELACLAAGVALPGTANYWCAFVVAAIRSLRPGGALCAILPASWDFADYSKPFRDLVADSFERVTVVRSRSPLFPDVQDGSIVLIAHNRGGAPQPGVRVEVKDAEHAICAIAASKEVSSGQAVAESTSIRQGPSVPLGSLLEIGIGAVVGDSRFFLMSEPTRRSLGLPSASCVKVVSRASHLKAAVLDLKEWAALRDSGERVWLFCPPDRELHHPRVKEYLAHGEMGACNLGAFKIRSRSPWWKTKSPRPPDGFISGTSSRLPHLVLNDTSVVTATNTLYVARFIDPALAPDDRARVALSFMTTVVRNQLSETARRYADGLLKFEPRDLRALRMPTVRKRSGALSALQKATMALVEGDAIRASLIADNWLLG